MNSTTDLYLKRWHDVRWSTANYFCSNDDTFLPEMDELNSFDNTNEMIAAFQSNAAFDDSIPANRNQIWERSEKIIRIGDSPV